jgi:hypothetical protein
MQNLQRAKLLYETALLRLSSDATLWISYIQFIQRELKDITLARVYFEKCKNLFQDDTSKLADFIQLNH